MALLLRMGGIPARVATGFSPGGYSERRDAWIVRDTDAHAWVEAWFDELGWVTFDPTPDATPARSQIAALERRRRRRSPTSPTGGDPAAGGAASGAAAERRCGPNLLLDPLRNSPAGAAGDAGRGPGLVGVGAGRARRRRSSLAARALLRAAAARGELTPMDRAIAELEDALRRVGRPVATGTTLRQLERRLGALAGGRRVPARAERRALRAGADAADGRAAAALRRALAQGLGPAGGCARCGRCRRGRGERRRRQPRH